MRCAGARSSLRVGLSERPSGRGAANGAEGDGPSSWGVEGRPGLQRPQAAEFRAGAPTTRGLRGHFAGGQPRRAGAPGPELGKCGAEERGGRRRWLLVAGRGTPARGRRRAPIPAGQVPKEQISGGGRGPAVGARLRWAPARLGAAERLGLPYWEGWAAGTAGNGGPRGAPRTPSLGPSPRHTCPGLFARLSPPAPQRRVICGWRAQRLLMRGDTAQLRRARAVTADYPRPSRKGGWGWGRGTGWGRDRRRGASQGHRAGAGPPRLLFIPGPLLQEASRWTLRPRRERRTGSEHSHDSARPMLKYRS